MKNITLALQMYAQDNDGVLPAAGRWCDQAQVYVGNRSSNVFLCEDSWGTASAYSYDNALDRASLGDLTDPASLIAIFESNAGWNAHGGSELLVNEPRHLGGDNYGFADGHAAWLPRKKLGTDDRGNPIWAKEAADHRVMWDPVLKKTEEEPQ